MKKLILKSGLASSITLAISLSSSALASPIVVPDAPQIAAKGYVLMDYHSGKVLAEKESNTKLSPASLTKMMTSYVIGQELQRGNISLNDDVTISKNAWAKNFPDSSKMFIEVGTTVKVRDLNRGIIIQSGNDACVAMAEHIAGTEEAFVDLMNAWASSLNMKNSHFTNSHGLDDANLYSTPYDLALLGQALIRDVPDEYAIYAEQKYTYNGITQYNRNGLLWDKSMNVDGIKTGHTSGAGYNLVSSATEGSMNTIALGVAEDTYVTLPRGQAKDLTASFVLEKELKAPLKKGDVVGTLYYQLSGNDLVQYPLMALEDVEEGSLFNRLWDYLVLLFKSWF